MFQILFSPATVLPHLTDTSGNFGCGTSYMRFVGDRSGRILRGVHLAPKFGIVRLHASLAIEHPTIAGLSAFGILLRAP
jgi:hypothetical protein